MWRKGGLCVRAYKHECVYACLYNIVVHAFLGRHAHLLRTTATSNWHSHHSEAAPPSFTCSHTLDTIAPCSKAPGFETTLKARNLELADYVFTVCVSSKNPSE